MSGEREQRNELAGHFTYKRLLRFTIPSILTLSLCNTFELVNGFFASNALGKEALAGINLISPIMLIFGALGYMIGIGGCAILAVILGKGERYKAQQAFTTLIIFTFVFGIVLAVIGILLMEPLLDGLGATGETYAFALEYGRILFFFITPNIAYISLSYFMIGAGRPGLNLGITLVASLVNAVLSYLLVEVFSWGVGGAACACGLGYTVGCVIQLVFFKRNTTSNFKLVKPLKDLKIIGRSLLNGIGEYIANIAESLIGLAYNFQLLHLFMNSDNVAAFGCVTFWQVLFACAMYGFMEGAEPLISFNYGAGNDEEIRSLFKKTLIISLLYCVAMAAMGLLVGNVFVDLLLGYDPALAAHTTWVFQIFFLAFLFKWAPSYGAALFTAFNNGKIAALITFSRSFILELGLIFLLPMLFGPDAIWFAVLVADFISMLFVIALFFVYRKRYKLC